MIMTPRQVCDDAEKNDWNNVVSCFSSVGRPSQRVADAQKSRMTMLILAIVMVVMVMIMVITMMMVVESMVMMLMRLKSNVQPLYGDGQGGEDAAGHAGVRERVDQVGEEDGEHAAVRLSKRT